MRSWSWQVILQSALTTGSRHQVRISLKEEQKIVSQRGNLPQALFLARCIFEGLYAVCKGLITWRISARAEI